ncbi:MAG: primosomal protein N' [Bacteroidia bacterium]|nr:primosomal protein N' [Bacteroidia bacterium]
MFADVILPLPFESFTYAVPAPLQNKAGIGFRVIVPFGKRKLYTAIIHKLHNNAPKGIEVKEIHSLIDSHPVVTEKQLRLWEWISFYYMSPLGDVYKAAVPSKLKLESETSLTLTDADTNNTPLTPTEEKIVEILRKTKSQSVSKTEKQLNIKDLLPHLYSLVFKNIVEIQEDIKQKYTSKTETFIRFNTDMQDNAEQVIGRAAKQAELYRTLKKMFLDEQTESIAKKRIMAETRCSNAVLNGLIEKDILIQYFEDVSRIKKQVGTTRNPFKLNEHQQTAFGEINSRFEEKNVCLLHGVTSSGKTEIYIHLIREQLKLKKQTLYLVPEIALTTQLTTRLQAVFGDKLGIYHSKINDNERTEIWQKMLSASPYEIVIGVRSSLFLPYRNLGLVIVDEEHETSYKQQEPAPRYHARDTAIMLAHICGAKTLLGSATPSVESFHNAKTGKYGLVTLAKRFENIELPQITFENTKELRRTKKMKSVLAPGLIEKINTALQSGQQVILFRNRRGFAPMLECKLCGWTPKCSRCDVSLTYHKNRKELKCHYCNKTYKPVYECPACHEKSVQLIGMGTEKLEEEVATLFPDAAIARMDTDTTRGKNVYEKIISDFQDKKVQILVGTQMLSKGLDFDNVSIVGIIAADGLLNHPDFRSHERGFQLMLQAAGRAGRKNRQGEVVIQTADPEQPVYRYLQTNDYAGFFHSQLAERKLFHYPPYKRLISIVFKHNDERKVELGSEFFSRLLKQSLGEMVLGPNKPVISRIQRYHIRDILLKLDTNISTMKVRAFLKSVENRFRENPDFKYVVLFYDVDGV